MARYSATFAVAGVNTANSVLANLKGGADRIALLEFGVFVETAPATAPILALQRMNAVGTGAITNVAGVAHDGADSPALAAVETAWATTRPTLLANTILRRLQIPVTVGGGIIWGFQNAPIIVPVSGGLCFININASGATLGQFGGYFVWDE